MIVAKDIMDAARQLLRDPLPGLIWTDADLFRFVIEGERTACDLRPDLFTVRGPIPMVEGTLQALPLDATALIRLDRNVTGGQSCRLVDAALLDAASWGWSAAAPASAVWEYAVDAKDRKRFRVSPPNDGTGSVVAHYGVVPPPLASAVDPIHLEDIHDITLKHFVLSEAFAFATPRQDMVRAKDFRESFMRLLKMNVESISALQPKYGTTPGAA